MARFWCATSTKKRPFTATWYHAPQGTCLIDRFQKIKNLCKLTGDPTCVPAPLRDDALRAAPRDLLHLPQDLQAQVQPRLPPEAVTQLTEEQDIATLPAAICAYGNPDMHLCIWEPWTNNYAQGVWECQKNEWTRPKVSFMFWWFIEHLRMRVRRDREEHVYDQ